MTTEIKKPLPPFDFGSATIKVKMAENAWNTKDPQKIALAYTKQSVWRNRDQFVKGREKIIEFLTQKYIKELDYKLCKELWTYSDHKIAVRFAYEWHDENDQWFRSYGNENWEFDENGLMKRRYASINDIPIQESERKLLWEGDLRPNEYLSLTEMGL